MGGRQARIGGSGNGQKAMVETGAVPPGEPRGRSGLTSRERTGRAAGAGRRPPLDQPGSRSARSRSCRPATLLVEAAAPATYAAKPQHVWRWQIAGYLYLGGLGAGAFAVAVVLDWLGFGLSQATAPRRASGSGIGRRRWCCGGRSWREWARPCSSSTSAGTGGASSRQGTTLGPRGWPAVSASSSRSSCCPSWSPRSPSSPLSGGLPLHPWWSVVEVVAVVAALGTAAYTGILLRSMEYILAWRSPFVPLLFFVSALSTGAMAVLLGSVAFAALGGDAASAERSVRAIEVVEPVLLAFEAAVLMLYVRSLGRGKPEAALSARTLLRGAWRYPFWIGVVGCALAIPLVARSRQPRGRLVGGGRGRGGQRVGRRSHPSPGRARDRREGASTAVQTGRMASSTSAAVERCGGVLPPWWWMTWTAAC